MIFTEDQLAYLSVIEVDPVADPAEAAYAVAEREGMRLDALVLCPECPDPALCAAEGECPR